MNKKKTTIIGILLFSIIGMGTLLFADSVNIAGLIQTGDYYDNIEYITMPNPSANMVLQDVELEDYYSAKVSELYSKDTNIFNAGSIEFAYNLDEDGSFIDGYVVKSSDRTANDEVQGCDEQSSYQGYCISEEEYNALTADIPEIEEVSGSEYNAMTKQQKENLRKQDDEIANQYEVALKDVPQVEAGELSTIDESDVIVDYYKDETSYNNALSASFGQEMTYQDLSSYNN